MVFVAVSWAVVSWAVVSWVASWVSSWAVVSSWDAVRACNTQFLPAGPNLAVVKSALVHILLRLLYLVLMVRCCVPIFGIAYRVHVGCGVVFVSHAL